MFFTKRTNGDSDTQTIDEIISNDPFELLNVNFKSFDLEIKAGEKFEIHYHGPKYRKPTVKVDHDETIIKEPDLKEKEIFHWEKSFFKMEIHSSKGKVTIMVPKETELTEVNLNLASGDVRLSSLKISSLELESNSGDVDGENLRIASLDLSATSGDVAFNRLRLISGDISVTSGDTRLIESRIEHELSISTVSGDNLVKNTQVAEANLNTVSGENQIFGEKKTHGSVGQQDGSFLRMNTISGDNLIE